MNQESKFLFDPEKVNEALKSAKSMDDLFAEGGALQLMLKNSMETMLKAELEDHFGYSHRDSKNKKTSNSRNGNYKKTGRQRLEKLNLIFQGIVMDLLNQKLFRSTKESAQNSKSRSLRCTPKE